MHPFLVIADRAARLAGKRILQTFDNRDRLKIYEKQSKELVTDLDYSVEKLLIEHIHTAYPTHSILSEESGLLKRDEDYLWMIDPLDGTHNFIRGLPGFSISMAFQKQGVLTQGLVYDPLSRETFYASQGQVAHVNQKRLKVSNHNKLERALLGINRFPREPNRLQSYLKTNEMLAQKLASVRLLGSAALSLAYVAAGRLDGFISHADLKIWDIAAGSLLVQEAGGDLFDIEGNNQYLETGRLVAGNSYLCKDLVSLINSST